MTGGRWQIADGWWRINYVQGKSCAGLPSAAVTSDGL